MLTPFDVEARRWLSAAGCRAIDKVVFEVGRQRREKERDTVGRSVGRSRILSRNVENNKQTWATGTATVENRLLVPT